MKRIYFITHLNFVAIHSTVFLIFQSDAPMFIDSLSASLLIAYFNCSILFMFFHFSSLCIA